MTEATAKDGARNAGLSIRRAAFVLTIVGIATLPVTLPPVLRSLGVGVGDGTKISLQERASAVEVRPMDLTSSIELRGQVMAARTVAVELPPAAQASGLPVDVGAPVRAGQVLATWELPSGRTGVTRSPISGTIVERGIELAGEASALDPSFVIASTARIVTAQVDASQLYQLPTKPLNVSATIVGGPGPFRCAFLSTAQGVQSAKDQPGSGQRPTSGGARFTCAVPRGVRGVEGAAATVVIVAAERKASMALPRTAVDGVAGRGGTATVYRVTAEDKAEPVQVTLGLATASFVEIVSGLRLGERVFDPAALVDAAR